MRGSEDESGDDLQLGNGGDGEDIIEAEEEVLDEDSSDGEGAEDGTDPERGPAAADEEEGQARQDRNVNRHRRPSQTERRARTTTAPAIAPVAAAVTPRTNAFN